MLNVQLDDYLVVAERDNNPEPTPLTFLTSITDMETAEKWVYRCLDEDGLNLDADFDWGVDGLMIRFKNTDDLTLFTIAYQEPLILVN